MLVGRDEGVVWEVCSGSDDGVEETAFGESELVVSAVAVAWELGERERVLLVEVGSGRLELEPLGEVSSPISCRALLSPLT